MRRKSFAQGEIYHVYNRGIDKRTVFEDTQDFDRFLESIQDFNGLDPIGSIYENSFVKAKTPLGGSTSKLTKIIAYCLNPNHYHLIVEQVAEQGVEKLMHRLGTGYTMYFNRKYHRNGALFQGAFKAIHIDSNDYLLHLSAYVNLNDIVHQLGGRTSKSSWDEYKFGREGVCAKEIILMQFTDGDYVKFAEDSLKQILERKQLEESFAAACLED